MEPNTKATKPGPLNILQSLGCDKTHGRHCKMSSKKIDLKRDFAAGVYLSEAQNPILPSSPYTLYRCLFTQRREKEGKVEPERRLEGKQFRKLGRNYLHD
jgi:hypothetical protein